MDIISFSDKVIETQGIVAFLLLVMIVQNYIERKAMLKKNCELTSFIMECLRKELNEEHKL